MELTELKIKLYQKCILKQTKIIENAKAAMDEAQTAANEYGGPKDRYDSFRAQILRKKDLFAEQYNKALKELSFLQSLNPEISNKIVVTNTLVITNKQKFYISIGLGKVELLGIEYFVISPSAPIFHALKERTIGDTILFNDQKITILDLA